MKTKNFFLILVVILLSNSIEAQLKVRTDGSIQTGYTGYANFWLGTQPSGTTDNGKWGIEIWGNDFNIWKPWPSSNYGNYFLFICGANGYVGIGRYPSYKLDVNGDIATYGTLRISSDSRLKTDIKKLTGCMDKLNKLNGQSYKKICPKLTYNYSNIKDSIKLSTMKGQEARENNQKNSNPVQFGLLAEEVKAIYPELVSADSAGYYTVDYIGLIPVIIEALKEQ
jgi:hypothetical protein